MVAAATSSRSVGRFSAISRCRRLRRSIMEKNASTRGRCPSKLARNSVSWSRVRSDSTVGISGTSRLSAA
jgi:hypothetical protein